MPPNGTSTQATDEMVNGIHSPPSDSTQDSQETCQSPDKKSPRAPSKLDKAREKNEQLQGRQVQLLREKTKWKDRKKLLEDILDKMIHSRVCLDQTCSIITKTNDLSAELDNDILSVLPGSHSRDQTVKQMSQPTQVCCHDNNPVQGKVHDSLVPEQILPKQIRCSFDNDPFDATCVKSICFNNSPVYAISPDGRIDHDLSDSSDDSGKSTVSDIAKHNLNGFFSSTQQEQHHENFLISETHVTYNNSKEENNYIWLAELDNAPTHTKRTVENFINYLQDKPEEDKCQSPCVAETLPSSNTRPSLKRQSCSWEARVPARRARHMITQEACLIKHKSADNTDVKESVLVAEAENTSKSESSTEVSPARNQLPVPELDKEGSPANNEKNENTFTKEDKEKGESGKKLDSTPEKPQTEMGRSAMECQSNMSVAEIDSDALNKAKEMTTISDPAQADRSNKIEHTETYKPQVEGHNTDATLNTVTVLGEETPVLESKVKIDSVNKKCQVISENMKEQLITTENNAEGAVLQIVECPKDSPKEFGSDASEPARINDGIKKKDVQAEQNTYNVTVIDEKSHIKVLKVNENCVADLPTEDTAKVLIEPDNARGQDETGVCNLIERDIKPHTIKIRESSNTTGSATKALSTAVRHTQGKRVLADTNNKKDCTSIMESTTMNSSEPSSRMTGLKTTGYWEERGIALAETVNMGQNVAIGHVVVDQPNNLRDSKDKEERAIVFECDDHKSDCNTRKRLPKTVNNVEAHLKTCDNHTTEEAYLEINNSVGGAGKMVSIYIKKASVDAVKSASQQNKATVDNAGTKIHRAIYSTEWRERLFCFYISLAMLLFVGLLELLSYTNM